MLTLTSGGVRGLSMSRGNGVPRGVGVITGALGAGIVAGRVRQKNIAAAGAAALGLAGLFLMPGRYQSPIVRGFSEGLVGSGAAQLGAQLGAKMARRG